jgi:hypothetical protein
MSKNKIHLGEKRKLTLTLLLAILSVLLIIPSTNAQSQTIQFFNTSNTSEYSPTSVDQQQAVSIMDDIANFNLSSYTIGFAAKKLAHILVALKHYHIQLISSQSPTDSLFFYRWQPSFALH